jgi:DNA-binding MarR family transcriptional regulator
MTRLVDGLEKRSWVARKKAEDDARRVLVSLTPDGKKEAKRLHRLTEKSIATILNRIPKLDRPQVIRSLNLLRTAADQTRTHLDCC